MPGTKKVIAFPSLGGIPAEPQHSPGLPSALYPQIHGQRWLKKSRCLRPAAPSPSRVGAEAAFQHLWSSPSPPAGPRASRLRGELWGGLEGGVCRAQGQSAALESRSQAGRGLSPALAWPDDLGQVTSPRRACSPPASKAARSTSPRGASRASENGPRRPLVVPAATKGTERTMTSPEVGLQPRCPGRLAQEGLTMPVSEEQ